MVYLEFNKVATKTKTHKQYLFFSSSKRRVNMKCVDNKGKRDKLKSAFSLKWIFHLFIDDIFDWCSSIFVGYIIQTKPPTPSPK